MKKRQTGRSRGDQSPSDDEPGWASMRRRTASGQSRSRSARGWSRRIARSSSSLAAPWQYRSARSRELFQDSPGSASDHRKRIAGSFMNAKRSPNGLGPAAGDGTVAAGVEDARATGTNAPQTQRQKSAMAAKTRTRRRKAQSSSGYTSRPDQGSRDAGAFAHIEAGSGFPGPNGFERGAADGRAYDGSGEATSARASSRRSNPPPHEPARPEADEDEETREDAASPVYLLGEHVMRTPRWNAKEARGGARRRRRRRPRERSRAHRRRCRP